jgi:hypothetical protein
MSFKNVETIQRSLECVENPTLDRIVYAWMIINLYEVAFMGYRL